MPFTRSPTLSSRNMNGTRPQPHTKRSETSSPPRRSNTRKVNVVSKASLAMLNPAYAMGIESGPSWFEEKERIAREAAGSPIVSPSGSFVVESPWASDSTPELEAFMTDETPHHEEGGLGLILGAPAMQRKISSDSVFEDDEPIHSRKQACPALNSSSSSTLSRFFTWKKPAKGKPSSPFSSSWDVPRSAPSHIQSFDLPSNERIPVEASISVPSTPADVSIAPLTSPSRPTMSRKSSMPTLRDIRRAAGSPLTVELPFSQINTAATANSFYWRADSPRTPTLSSPSTSCSSNLSSKSTATRNNSRISSMGRGAARKSSVEASMIPIILIKAPKKKQQQRSDAWDVQNMPPIPSHPSVASLIAEDRQGSGSCPSIRTSSSVRRRSRSVDALPMGFDVGRTSPAPPMTRSGSSQSQMAQVVRINVAGQSRGTVVGTASPKLLAKTSPSMFNSQSPQRSNNQLLQVVESPVVVNVMPPTPDIGSIEQGTFEGASASPSVRRSRSETEITRLIDEEKSSRFPETMDNEDGSDEETILPYATGERFEESRHSRNDSIESSIVSESPVSVASRMTEDNDDEVPFGFARSMSMMSLSSEASIDSELSEDGVDNVESAKILSASSTMSSFSRALLISPRLGGEFNSWSSQGGLSNSSGDTSMTSLASSSFSSSNKKRSSKRLSDLPSLSSGQSLASLMTTSSSILDYGAEYIYQSGEKSNLSSPVELQGQLEGEDCDTPRLSDGFSGMNTTKPLVVRKNKQGQNAQTDYQQGVLSPISPRPFPRAHNATSPHLELDLSLPLDLHEIGLGFAVDEVPRRREKPRVPLKSRARHHAAEPKTPPTATRLSSSVMKEERQHDTFGLGLGLGLDSAFSSLTDEDNITPWKRHHHHHTIKSTNRPTVTSSMGMAL